MKKAQVKEHLKAIGKSQNVAVWTNQEKDHSRLTMDKEDKDFLNNSQKEQKDLEQSMKESFRQRDERVQAEKIRKLEAEVGNLRVQNADYSQIVQELSDKLEKYNTKYGIVFTKGSSKKT